MTKTIGNEFRIQHYKRPVQAKKPGQGGLKLNLSSTNEKRGHYEVQKVFFKVKGLVQTIRQKKLGRTASEL